MKVVPMNQSDLLRGIANGEEESFCRLFDLYKQKVYSYSFHFTRSTVHAEEITQEVFMKIWTGRESMVNVENIEAWISTVTRNLCFNYLKKLALERRVTQAAAGKYNTEGEEQVQRYMEYKDQLHILQEAVEQLSPQQKLIFQLNREQGLKNEEIANRLNISPNTVKTHLVSALRKIRQYLQTHPAHTILLLLVLALVKKIWS